MVPSSKKQLEWNDPRLHPERLYPLGLNYSHQNLYFGNELLIVMMIPDLSFVSVPQILPLSYALQEAFQNPSPPWVRCCSSPRSLHLRTDLLYTSYHIIVLFLTWKLQFHEERLISFS